VEAERIDARLRALPGYQARADAMLVEYWERRAAAAEAQERRDEALLYRLRAYEAGPTADAGRALELAGGDHRRLLAVIRPDGPIEAFAPLADGRRIVTVSAGNVVEAWDSQTGMAEPGARLELLAEEFVTLRRRLSLEAAGSVAALSLELAVEHPRMADLSLALTAPSGKRVEWSGSSARTGREGAVFDESSTPELRALRGEPIRGSWLLEVEDRQAGESGFFAGWTLRTSAAHRAQDRPEHPLLLPDPTPSSSVRVAMSPQGTVVAATPRNPQARGRLRTWRIEDGDRLASIAVGAGERWIGFAGEDRLMLVESSPPGQRLRVLAAASGDTVLEHRSRARFGAGPVVSPDASHIAVGEATPRQVWIRELATGRETFRLPVASEAMAVAVAAEGRLLAVAEPGHGVRLWRVADRRLLGEFAHNLPVVSISFDAATRWLVTADAARRIRIWDIASPGDAPVLSRPAGESLQYGFDKTGDLFAALGHARGYEVWKLPEGLPFGPLLRHGETFVHAGGGRDLRGAGSLAFASDGRLVAGQATHSLRVWKMAEEGAPADMPRVAPVVALASSGLRVAAGLSDGRVVLRARDPESLLLRQAPVTTGEYHHGEEVTALAFSPDGSRLVSVGAEGSVLLWEAATGRNIGALFHHGGGRVEAVDLGPDGRLLVTAGELGARVWDAATGSPGPILGPGRKVSAIVLDPSGRRAFTGTPAGEIESWDLESGERLWAGAIQAPVTRLAVSSDGQRLAVAAETGLVHAWRPEPGSRPLATILAAPVTGLQFSPDGTVILAQTPAWMQRLGEADGRLTVLASRMLPGAAPPGAWRSAVPDGLRVVLVGGARSETLSVLDFERAPLPPEDWVAQLDAWQRRLKLYFDADGELRSGLPAVPVPVFRSLPADEGEGIPETLRAPPGN
jgi:WD40 repeat protein